MSIGDDAEAVVKTARNLQVIIGSMAAGVATFIVVVAFLIPPPVRRVDPAAPAPVAALPVLSVVSYTFTAIFLPLSFVVPGIVGEALRKKLAAGKFASASKPGGEVAALAAIYQTRSVVGAALNEAPAFLATIAYMIERNPIALGLAVALVGTMVMRVPTASRVAAWVDDQRERLQSDRAAAQLG